MGWLCQHVLVDVNLDVILKMKRRTHKITTKPYVMDHEIRDFPKESLKVDPFWEDLYNKSPVKIKKRKK